jgi:hypothetical protein
MERVVLMQTLKTLPLRKMSFASAFKAGLIAKHSRTALKAVPFKIRS